MEHLNLPLPYGHTGPTHMQWHLVSAAKTLTAEMLKKKPSSLK